MEKYGKLLSNDIKLHRRYFDEMVRLLGIQVVFRAPRPGKHYTTYAEIETNYYEPKLVGCIFNEHPNQKTLKKMGWVSELQEEASLISVPYDLEGIQRGALFIIPSGIDDAKGRVFRVESMNVSMIYPSSITCEIVPEYENTYQTSQSIVGGMGVPILNREEDDEDDDI